MALAPSFETGIPTNSNEIETEKETDAADARCCLRTRVHSIRIKEGIWLFLLTQFVIYAALAVNHVVLRFRSAGGAWPASGELNTPWLVIASSGLLLGVAALCLWQSTRAGRAGQAAPVRKWILLAAGLCLLSLGSRVIEIRNRVTHGIYPRTPRPMLYDRADIHYLQAVRQELERRYGRLEEKLRLRPDQFTDEDRSDLERVSQLQADMVRWSELDLALRLDDALEKQARIETVAYQIHPLKRLQSRVESFLSDQKQDLVALHHRMELLKDYYSAKSRLQRELRELERMKSSEANDAEASKETQRVMSSLEQLDEQWRSRLEDLSTEDQTALKQALEGSSDWSATTQLAKQLDMQLGRVEGRQRFLEETASPAGGPGSNGLNRQYPWLRLPMLLPGANRWASSYYMMTGVHMLHVLILLCVLLWLLPSRLLETQHEHLSRAKLFCQFTVVAWLGVFCILYFL